ncbi:MAG: O-antigen ligase family protein [Burkholderiales bacterium]|nr:O-antigen ligase family protein [Burkholderiales bacterium]
MSAIDPFAPDAVPLAARGEEVFQRTLAFSLAALGFFLPFSVAGTAVALFALLLLACCAPVRVWRLAPWRQPVMAAGLVLLAWIALRTLGESHPLAAKLAALNRYHELVMVPLLWCLLRLARMPDALWRGLLLGTFAYAGAHWMVQWAPAVAPWLESRRISGGLVFPVVAFLLFELARDMPQRRRWMARGGALFLLATAIFFADGRTGHVLALLMTGLIAWRAAPPRQRVLAALLVLLASACIALLSPAVRDRLTETMVATQADRQGTVAASSTGYRIQVWRNAIDVARNNALLGTGWAGYRQAYEAAAARPGRDEHWMHADNPHNEYLMQLGAGGVLALALFLAWLGLPLHAAWRERSATGPWPPMLACVTLAFAAGCVVNSLLLDFAGGHFHAALLAWLLARHDHH